MNTLRVGFVGAGGIVLQRHLPGLKNIPGVEFAVVANSTLESSQRFCQEHAPGAKPLGSWQEVVAHPDVDIVWIGATPYLHEPATIAALHHGKHVFCQARMARDLAEAERMHAAASERPDRVTMLCPPPHGLTGDRFIRELLGEKVIGDVRNIHLLSLNGAFSDREKPAHWRQRREISGLNILTLGIHTEVIQRWLGDFTPIRAIGRFDVRERHGYRISIPDALRVKIEGAAGFTGTLEFSGVYTQEPVERLEIAGTTGTLFYDYLSDRISLQRPGREPEVLPIPQEQLGGWTVEADFIDAVRDPAGARPHPDFTDGVRYMRVVQRVADILEETVNDEIGES